MTSQRSTYPTKSIADGKVDNIKNATFSRVVSLNSNAASGIQVVSDTSSLNQASLQRKYGDNTAEFDPFQSPVRKKTNQNVFVSHIHSPQLV